MTSKIPYDRPDQADAAALAAAAVDRGTAGRFPIHLDRGALAADGNGRRAARVRLDDIDVVVSAMWDHGVEWEARFSDRTPPEAAAAAVRAALVPQVD